MHQLTQQPGPGQDLPPGLSQPNVAVPQAELGVLSFLGWLEAPLMNVMGPLFPLSKGMLIIFSSLIIWLMRD